MRRERARRRMVPATAQRLRDRAAKSIRAVVSRIATTASWAKALRAMETNLALP